jgi:large subunit ribosomal protein L13
MNNKTIKPKDISRKWHLVNAEGQVLGRLATKLATVLQGKHRAYYSPQWDMGDYVVVVNCELVRVTGKKEDQKIYYHHTGFPGGLKEENLASLRKRKPEEIIRKAVKNMLPKNRLAEQMIKKLHIYVGAQHPHEAQKPEVLEIKY